MIKSVVLLACVTLVTTGCSLNSTTHSNEWLTGQAAVTGQSMKEPCIKCGEDWIFIQNEPFAAQHLSRREQGYDGTNWGTTVKY